MRCLVVGGAGYLGGPVVDLLLQAGHDVCVYDSLLYEDAYLRDVGFAYGDVRDGDRLRPHLAWADVVVWLAAIVGDGACALDPSDATEVNHDAVAWLAGHFDGRIVFPSTCSVYGAQDGLLAEGAPTSPLSLYAATKLAAETRLVDRDAMIFRLGTLYGLGGRVRLDLVVNTLTAQAVAGRRLRVFGGEQYRSLLHVRDAAAAIAAGVQAGHAGVVNLASENLRVIDVAGLIRDAIPGTELDIVETSFEDARNYRVDAGLARDRLGFTPGFTVRDGIAEVLDLLESGRVKDPGSRRYSNQAFLSGRGHAA